MRRPHLPGPVFGLLALTLCSPASSGWFENSEQEGERLFNRGEFAQAARTFKDDYRRGVALYQNQEYQKAETAFERVEREDVRLDARYNLGNTRFQLADYEGAIRAYEEVLSEDPGNQNARYNQGLAKALLAETDPEALARLEQEKETEKKEQEQKKEQQQEEEQKSEQQQSEQQQSQSASQQDSQQQSQQQNSADNQQQEQMNSAETMEKDEQLDKSKPESEVQQAQQQAPTDAKQQDLSQQATEQWLRKIPDDPGGLLRRKFQYQYR